MRVIGDWGLGIGDLMIVIFYFSDVYLFLLNLLYFKKSNNIYLFIRIEYKKYIKQYLSKNI